MGFATPSGKTIPSQTVREIQALVVGEAIAMTRPLMGLVDRMMGVGQSLLWIQFRTESDITHDVY